jgi:hypothetical protein
VDCISAAGSKSTAFGTLVSIIKNTELFASTPSTLVLPAASLNLSLATLGGVGFNATNDKLILDTDITLRGDITATNKVIGTVAGLEYTYTHSSQTLIISKTSGTFVAEDVAKVVESIKLKNTSA